ncbi:hypothetical protein [Aquidulcibacter sp.]|jgi:hypothetical protein|uniref:hypothetical protein n=1 Tax=Aquidulcibacter sp. TaxID=2052990 RepID=UPI003BA56CB5
MSALEKPKAIFSPKWLVSVGALAVCGGAFGYVTGDWFAERFPHGGGFSYLAEQGYPPLTIISLVLGGILLFIYVCSAIVYGLAIVNKGIASNRVLTGGLGGNPSSRKAYPYIFVFYVAYAAVFGILTLYAASPNLPTSFAWPMFLIGLVSSIAMAWSATKLWFILDEFFRTIWVEACALASFIMLVIVLIVASAVSVGLMPAVTLYSGLVLYQLIYLITYGIVAGARDPNMLEMGEPEDA